MKLNLYVCRNAIATRRQFWIDFICGKPKGISQDVHILINNEVNFFIPSFIQGVSDLASNFRRLSDFLRKRKDVNEDL